MSRGQLLGIAALLTTVALAVAPLVDGRRELSTGQHHLLHALLAATALASAIMLAKPSHHVDASHYGWLIATLLAPIGAMLLMWPSRYAWFEGHPLGHVCEHLGIAACAFVTGYSGQRYMAGVGWAAGLSLVLMAALSSWGFGVAPAVVR